MWITHVGESKLGVPDISNEVVESAADGRVRWTQPGIYGQQLSHLTDVLLVRSDRLRGNGNRGKTRNRYWKICKIISKYVQFKGDNRT